MQQEQGRAVYAAVYLLPTERQMDILASPDSSRGYLAKAFRTPLQFVEGPFAFSVDTERAPPLEAVTWVVEARLGRARILEAREVLATLFQVPEDDVGVVWWRAKSESMRPVQHLGPAARSAVRSLLDKLFDGTALRRPIPGPDFDDPPDEDDEEDGSDTPNKPNARRK